MPCKAIENCEAHSVTFEFFFLNQEFLRTSVYNVYGSQNEFVDSVTRVSFCACTVLGQNGPLRRDANICGSEIAKLSSANHKSCFIISLM